MRVVPRVRRHVAVVDEDVVRLPVLRLARQPVAALQQQHALAGRREVADERAAPGAAADHDDVVVAHEDIQGSCQRPWPASRRSASCGPHDPLAYGWTGGGASTSGCMTRHACSTPSWRLKRVLSPCIAACSSTSYGAGTSIALGAELHVEVDLLGLGTLGPSRPERQPHAGGGIELDHELIGVGRPAFVEAEPRRSLEHEPQLGLRDRQVLAGADEERHARPAPVVDLQPHRREGLGRRVVGDPVDLAVAVVLPAHVVRRVGRRHRVEDGDQGVLDRVGIARRRRLHRHRSDDLHEVVDHHVAQRADRVVEVPAVLDAEALGHRDLDARDVVAVPDRLEDRVREAQEQELRDAELPEVVVDPVELVLVEVLVHLGRELARRRRGRGRTASRRRRGRSW